MASAPALAFAPELLLKAQGIRVAFFDVDGVLTDGGVQLSEYAPGDQRIAGEASKRFNILDGLGLQLLQRGGIVPVVITGRDSAPLRIRLASLGIEHAHYGVEDKLAVARQALAELGTGWEAAAAIGDDWPDLPVLMRCAFACAPASAHVEVRVRVAHVTAARGGHGAAREFCDLLLTAAGRYTGLLAEYTA